MKNNVCVGAVSREGRSVRLLAPDGCNQPTDSRLQIGEFYDIEFEDRLLKTHPHTEDILVHNFSCQGRAGSPKAMILSHAKHGRIQIYKGPLTSLYDHCLQLTPASPASCFISRNRSPAYSTLFWQPDRQLNHLQSYSHDYYVYDNQIKIKFIGFQYTEPVLTGRNILRLSLARWWQQDPGTEERCYLQLSGWF
ncbi:hypothetical protein HX098_08385 [Thiopseudomonas alkaliphila]|nr:hypothetical protein [Thiopseudomonas alkaliphila]MDM1708358.1 hypothetical protein [Thiopseudomonas alkaliphila]